MTDIAHTVRTWRDDGRAGVLATVIATRGLGHAADGDLTLLDDRGATGAPLLGGAIDTHLATLGQRLLASPDTNHTHTLRIDDGAADAAGLTCAGEVDVLLQRADALSDELWQALATGRPVALAIDTGGPSTSVHLADRRIIGSFGAAAVDDEIAQVATRLLNTPGNHQASVSVDGHDVVVLCWNPRPTAIILGANAIADALQAQFALLGWDARILRDGDEALDAFSHTHPGDAVLVLDHDPKVSTPLLAAALRAGRGYVGALGSRKTQVMRRTHLERAGVSETEVAGLHGPAGLDIGNRTPAETAVSIAAEIITFRSGRSAQPLQSTTGNITK